MILTQALVLSKGKKGKTGAEQVLDMPVDAAALVENLVTEDDTPSTGWLAIAWGRRCAPGGGS
jgi:hypothetical protein